MTQEDEVELVKAARTGDESAWAALYKFLQPSMQNQAFKLTKDEDRALDLVQDTFVQLVRKLNAFDGDCRLSSYVYRILFNLYLMDRRKINTTMSGIKYSQAHNLSSLDELFDGSTESRGSRMFGSTDIRQSGVVDRVVLFRAIAKLPLGYKQMYILHELHGYQHHEIARITGTSIGNCKSQLHKARGVLRSMLNDSYTAEEGARSGEADAVQVLAEVDPVQDKPVLQDSMENCKFGRVRAGVCLTLGCKEKRSHLDTSGYCRSCKIKHGLAVSKPYKGKTGTSTTVEVRQLDADEDDLTLDDKSINDIWLLLPESERLAVLLLYFPRLTKTSRFQLIKMAIERRRSQPLS